METEAAVEIFPRLSGQIRRIAVEEHALAHIIHGPHPEGRVATGATCGERVVGAPRHIGVNIATVDSRTQHAGSAALRE